MATEIQEISAHYQELITIMNSDTTGALNYMSVNNIYRLNKYTEAEYHICYIKVSTITPIYQADNITLLDFTLSGTSVYIVKDILKQNILRAEIGVTTIKSVMSNDTQSSSDNWMMYVSGSAEYNDALNEVGDSLILTTPDLNHLGFTSKRTGSTISMTSTTLADGTPPRLQYIHNLNKSNQYVQNGNFSNGANYWTQLSLYNTTTVSDGVMTLTKWNTDISLGAILYSDTVIINTSHLYYIRGESKATNASAAVIGFSASGGSVSGNTQISNVTDDWVIGSVVTSPVSGTDKFMIRVGESEDAEGAYAQFRNIICIDLTELFGAGNELTKAECDLLFSDEYYAYNSPIWFYWPYTSNADGTIHTFSTITLNRTERIYVRNLDNILSTSSSVFSQFSITGNIVASGNIQSLVNYISYVPAACYYRLFFGCTGLTIAPELPATTLATSCYYEMFRGCTRLISAPELPADTLFGYCYYRMFHGCTSLIQAPELRAPATVNRCYYEMFRGCTSLSQTPELPASPTTTYCYYGMFRGCTNISYVSVGATSWNTTNATYWLYQVADSGMFRKPSDTTISAGSAGIPSGWIVENY